MGSVVVQHTGQPSQRGTLLFPLQAGDIVTVRPGGSAELVLFENGARYALPAGTAARVEAARVRTRSGPAPKPLRSVSLDFVRPLGRPPRPVSPRLLGVLVRDVGDPTLGPRQPAPNGAVRAGPVSLHWAGPVEGEQLRLQIRDEQQAVHRAELPASAREYRVPDGVLRPGEYYVWSVTAVHAGESGPRCRALLRMLSPGERTALDRVEQETTAARAAAPDDTAPPLLLAQVYEQYGLFAEARAAYQNVLRLRPGDEGVQAALKRLAGFGDAAP